MTISMWIATVAWLLLVLGYIARRDRSRHVPLMLSGIGIDIALVTYLQLNRGAIQTALSFRMELLQQLHIGFSTGALILYFPVLYLGIKLIGAPASALRRTHVRIATVALVLRTVGFVLMFSMLGPR